MSASRRSSRLGTAAASGLVLASILVLVAGGVSLLSTNLANSVTIALMMTIALLGLSLFSGNSGLLSFAQVGFMAIGAYTAGLLVVSAPLKKLALPDLPGWLANAHASPFAAVLIAGVIAGVAGALTAIPMTRLTGAGAVIASLSVLIIIHVVLIATPSITRGSQTFYGLIPWSPFPVVSGIAAVAIVLVRVFRETRMGLALRASREDELAAAAVGIGFRIPRFVAWTLSAVLGGMSGALFGLFLGAFSPKQFYFGLTLTLVAMLVVGGISTVTGALAGVAAITLITELLRRAENGFSLGSVAIPQVFGLTDIGLAIAILIVMYVRPQGLVAYRELEQWPLFRRFRHDRPASAETFDWSQLKVEGATTLVVDDVRKSFSGIKAVDGVSIEVHTGEIVGVIGANGSGKSTLINSLSGLTRVDSGSVTLRSLNITYSSPQRRARNGLARTFQSIRLFSNLSVRDNVEAATISTRGDREVAASLVSGDLLASRRDRLASHLSYGDQRRLEIARAMATRPSILLLDEPAAGMNEEESSQLASMLRQITDEAGVGILVVDHDMAMMSTLCERLIVLDHGQIIAEGTADDVLNDPLVTTLYLGAEPTPQLDRNEVS